mmetsp:Transcript_3518/g.9899  ORF Transcript_3518/g.9899 Transcript_3518/m.9899 type:complete len:251 (+) Transcript_3518:219-971(+)
MPQPPLPSAKLPVVIVAQLSTWSVNVGLVAGSVSPSATIPRNIPTIIAVTVVIVLIITAFPSLKPRVWYTKPILVFMRLQPIPRRPKNRRWPTSSPTTNPLLVVVAESEKKHPANRPQVGAKKRGFAAFPLFICLTLRSPNMSTAKKATRVQMSLAILVVCPSGFIPEVAIPTPTIPQKHRPTANHSPNLSFSLKKKWLSSERKTRPPPETGCMTDTGAFASAETMKNDPDTSANNPSTQVLFTKYFRIV